MVARAGRAACILMLRALPSHPREGSQHQTRQSQMRILNALISLSHKNASLSRVHYEMRGGKVLSGVPNRM